MSQIISYREAIRQTMESSMDQNPNTAILGIGVGDPTGIFGTTKGLKEKHGSDRVIDTAIAEEGMTGVAIGMALNGVYPIHVHIRVDFVVLAMNQIINMASKYRYMYGGAFEVPMLIRCIIGRSWGQGPQHSQSLQATFAHYPGLTVIMPSTAHSILETYPYLVEKYKNPVISLEHRLLYDWDFHVTEPLNERKNPLAIRHVREGSDVTIVATSYMVEEATKAADWINRTNNGADISVEIIDVHNVSDIDHDFIYQSIKKTGCLIFADTSWVRYGVCAEISRAILERDASVLTEPPVLLGLPACPTPTSHALEKHYYPDMTNIVDAIYNLTSGKSHGKALPTEEERQSAKKFRGPF